MRIPGSHAVLAEENGNYNICTLHMTNSVRTKRSLNYSHQDNLQQFYSL